MRACFIFLIVFSYTLHVSAGVGPGDDKKKNGEKKELRSYQVARAGEAFSKIVIDGQLNEEEWESVDWAEDFTQFMPNEGDAPSQKTAFKILYDDKNLFIGIRAYDTEPDKIERRLARRDDFTGDMVEVNIDSYYDKRTAFSFTANAAGVKGDEYVSNDGDNWDDKWNPIWYLKTSIDEEGWIAEMKIPLSQLRFANNPDMTWGLQVTRILFREQERSIWQFVSQEESGWVRHFGEINGLRGIKPQKQIEIMPYVVAKEDLYQKEEGNPFRDGNDFSVNVGLDGKIGITSDITLDFTINPDFGQVEADPSQVNLSAFQVFFPERRPFFIEGNNILDYRIVGFRPDNAFYSRRIGGRPKGFPDVNENSYVKIPDFTTIIGAAKLTGKNKNGLSFGISESITAKEYAEIDTDGERTEELVEPLTNYFVSRVQQDINQGNTVVGGILTSTTRVINDPSLEFLHKQAWTGGLDVLHQWKDREYYVSMKTLFSNVKGTTEAITGTQESAERFYQRLDNNHRSVDTTRTSLSGSSGTFNIGKQSGKLIGEFGTTWRSPGVELNDVGFLRQADWLMQWVWMQYRIQKPFSIFRRMNFNLTQYNGWDFGQVHTGSGVEFNFGTQFKNFWGMNLWTERTGEERSNADLRGGPSIIYPGGTNVGYWVGTDSRKKFRVSFNQWFWWGDENYGKNNGYWMRFAYRPINALSLSIAPSISFSRNDQQYVATESFNEDPRYLTAKIDQKTYRIELRFNFNINPNLTITYWGQPFVSQGEYSDFKRVTNASATEYNNRFHTFTEDEIFWDETEDQYLIDENRDGTVDYSVYNPDFNFLQFRSNLVLRWEYIPGSEFYLVWTQNRSDSPPLTAKNNNLGGISSDLFTIAPQNTFLLKYTYRFRF